MKVIIEQHPTNVKLESKDATNIAYIHSFYNAIQAAHRTNLDLEGIWAQMREMLLAYMRNNPVRIENHLPLKDLVPFGMNFDFLLVGTNFYDLDKLLKTANEPTDFHSEVDEADDGGGDVEDASFKGGRAGVKIPERTRCDDHPY